MGNKKSKITNWYCTSLGELKNYYLYSIGDGLKYKFTPIQPTFSGLLKYIRNNIETSKENFGTYILMHKGRVVYSHN